MTRAFDNPLLIVEDSDEDYIVLERLMQKMAVQHPIHRCMDGDDALDFIFQVGPYKNETPRPAVILLDLNLPGTDGREVLQQVKGNHGVTDIPIVIFTSSHNPRDVEFCYHKGANGYLVKPMGLDKLTDTIQAFVNFWLNVNITPQEGNDRVQFP